VLVYEKFYTFIRKEEAMAQIIYGWCAVFAIGVMVFGGYLLRRYFVDNKK
jgi:hypothetical protein